MKIREILRSDLVYVPELFLEWDKEQKEAGVPYPYNNGAGAEFNLYALARIKKRDEFESVGGQFPWEIFVGIPQGNVPKGYVEVCIEQRFVGQPKVVCRILGLYVEPKSRNRGIARELFRSVVRFGAKFGAQAIEVAFIPKSRDHAFWLKCGIRSFMMQGVFAKNNWELFTEEDFEWASDHMQEEWQIGSSETKTPKVQPESTETSEKGKEALILVKG